MLDECKIKVFRRQGFHYNCLYPKKAFHSKHVIPMAKHGGVIVCFRAWSTLATMNSALKQNIFGRQSVILSLIADGLLQQDNVPKYKTSPPECLKRNKIKVLE